MAVPSRIRELRYWPSTTFRTTHVNAATSNWAASGGDATKLRVISFDGSGLEYTGEDDPTLESQWHAGRAQVPLTRMGTVAFGTWLEGGEASGAANPVATLLSKFMGGIQTGQADDAAEAAGSITVINAIGHGLSTGMAVLQGARGDSEANAEVRVIVNTDVNTITAKMAWPVAGASGAAVVSSCTVFFDPTATQSYLDLLAIGKTAEDQIQTIAGMGNFTLEAIAPGEAPKINFSVQVADWQEVPTANRDTLEPGTAASGNQPATLRGAGRLLPGRQRVDDSHVVQGVRPVD